MLGDIQKGGNKKRRNYIGGNINIKAILDQLKRQDFDSLFDRLSESSGSTGDIELIKKIFLNILKKKNPEELLGEPLAIYNSADSDQLLSYIIKTFEGPCDVDQGLESTAIAYSELNNTRLSLLASIDYLENETDWQENDYFPQELLNEHYNDVMFHLNQFNDFVHGDYTVHDEICVEINLLFLT